MDVAKEVYWWLPVALLMRQPVVLGYIVAGVLYGIPWYVDTRLLFYRSDLLAQAGYTTPPRSWRSPCTAASTSFRNAMPVERMIGLPLRGWRTLKRPAKKFAAGAGLSKRARSWYTVSIPRPAASAGAGQDACSTVG